MPIKEAAASVEISLRLIWRWDGRRHAAHWAGVGVTPGSPGHALGSARPPFQKFQVGNEKHSVWVEMKGRQPVIMVASTPADAMTHLAGLRQKCIRLGVHTQPGVRTGLATAATVINQEKRRIARAVGPAGATSHLGTGAADPKKQANSVVQRVRQALITVYEALDQAQHRSALVTINGT